MRKDSRSSVLSSRRWYGVNSEPHGEERRFAARLEPWPRSSVWPSFETRPSAAPQDEAGEKIMADAPKLLIPPFGRLYAIFAPYHRAADPPDRRRLARLSRPADPVRQHRGRGTLLRERRLRQRPDVGLDRRHPGVRLRPAAGRSDFSRGSPPARSSFFSSSRSSPITGRTATTGKRAASSIRCSGPSWCFISSFTAADGGRSID